MGVQGLTAQLEAGGRPRTVSLQDGEAKAHRENLLLIDASAVLYYLVAKTTDGLNWCCPTFHSRLYHEACRYYGGLQRTGLRCVLIADSATAPGHESTYTGRRQSAIAERRFLPPTADLVLFQAYRDLGLEVVRSLHSADQLLLAWAVRHRASLFALLTTDSDFYVYGVAKIIHPQDVVVDLRCVSVHVWSTEDLWCAWHVKATGTGAAFVPTLMQRAQVAAVLGNDASKDVRRRLEARRDATLARRVTPSMAARAVVQQTGQPGPLSLAFFRSPPISLRDFNAADVAAVNAVAEAYIKEEEAARNGSVERGLTMTEEALEWLDPEVARRLASSAPLPPLLHAVACRGFCTLSVPDPYWKPLQGLRRAVVERLLGDRAPDAAYEYEAAANALHPLVAKPSGGGGGAADLARKQWFRPEVHLPGMVVVAAAAAAELPLPQRQASIKETVQYLQVELPEMPATLAVYYALLLHGADADPAAWDEDEVRQVLLPGVPLRHGAEVSAAALSAAAAAGDVEEEAVAAQGALRTPMAFKPFTPVIP